MNPSRPLLVTIAGPNGAGKSTAAPALLRDTLEVTEFVNADAIAGGLSAFRPESVAMAAGRIMLERMRSLAESGESFAFETTLASRSFAPWIADLKGRGYHIHVMYLWLETAELALDRVEARVRQGGHDVPANVVRRRYERGLRNLFSLYLPLADSWQVFDNSQVGLPVPIASGRGVRAEHVLNEQLWMHLEETYHERS